MLDLWTPEGRLDRVTMPFPMRMAPADSMPDLSTSQRWHRCVAETLTPGDRVVVLVNGLVSERRADMLRNMAFRVDVVTSDLGEDVAVRDLARLLGRDVADEVKAVFVLGVEPSSGVMSDLVSVRRAMDESFHDALLLVEVPAATPSDNIPADIVITEGRGPLACLPEELDEHQEIVAAFRHGLAALDLAFVARRPRTASFGVSAIRLTETIDAAAVASRLRGLAGIQAESFYDAACGQILSILHPVEMTRRDCLAAMATLEMALTEAGAGTFRRVGVSAVRRHLGLDGGAPATCFDVAAE